MVVFPNSKINIGLNILDKRPDGFHNLETVFVPIPLNDSLEIIRAKENTDELTLSQSGFVVDGNTENNLCIKAYRLLRKDFPQLPAIQMHLHKAVPMGAGLGGGSSDAAFTLQMLNNKFQLGLSTEQLIQYALFLGSDCPFFIINKPCFATGRGEMIQPIQLLLAGYHLVLVNPGIHINTGWAFSQLKAGDRFTKHLLQNIHSPIINWRHTITNDFELPVFASHPQLKELKENLYNKGAVYAAMSGSGSTIFGLFTEPVHINFQFPSNWLVKHISL